ncbi:autoinducer binding domain-containing protein [Variovorax sp. KK3]|uniref:helix-turn-helix transcriptional regulator n=1 Tax=Variovorax sp. KK3 TaxID=1855728 RepID=UPI00097C7EF4|nr:autoinducer binding domain-containing protein [Variovorax sp. KK3]
MTSRLAASLDDPVVLRRLNEALRQISQADHVAEATAILREITGLLACNGAVFASFVKNDEDFGSYRYIVACHANWCTRYLEQRWFAIDPFLIYAQHNSKVAVGDDIPLRTEGQRAFRQHARAAGFSSIAVVPCHTAQGRSRMGVLYLTSDDASYFNSESIESAKVWLRAIAVELLEWWTQKLKAELAHRLALRPIDIRLLQLAHRGFKSKEIARLLDSHPATIDQRFARLSMRLNVTSRALAAKLAHDNGLLDE